MSAPVPEWLADLVDEVIEEQNPLEEMRFVSRSHGRTRAWRASQKKLLDK